MKGHNINFSLKQNNYKKKKKKKKIDGCKQILLENRKIGVDFYFHTGKHFMIEVLF